MLERDFDLSHIAEVGKKLGLWDAVSVTHDSKTGSYQVLIDTAGGRRNIVDAGDGIRCLLPTALSYSVQEARDRSSCFSSRRLTCTLLPKLLLRRCLQTASTAF